MRELDITAERRGIAEGIKALERKVVHEDMSSRRLRRKQAAIERKEARKRVRHS